MTADEDVPRKELINSKLLEILKVEVKHDLNSNRVSGPGYRGWYNQRSTTTTLKVGGKDIEGEVEIDFQGIVFPDSVGHDIVLKKDHNGKYVSLYDEKLKRYYVCSF